MFFVFYFRTSAPRAAAGAGEDGHQRADVRHQRREGQILPREPQCRPLAQ